MAVPKLRFKAADGSQFPDWEEKTIDEVAECLDNKRVPVNAEERKKRVGVIPYYGAGGIQGYIDDYLFDEELVLLLEDGDAFNDFQTKSIAQYVTGKSWVNNHAHVLRANGNSYFLFASLEHKDIRKWTQLAGASRKKLLKDSMLKITVNMPSLPEQQKIAEFLSTIDTVIEKQKETISAWEERKKGVMQKLFSQEVRFKADDGSESPDWKKKKLEDVVEFLDGQRKPLEAGQRVSGKYPYYGASGIIDYVNDYIFDEELILLSEDGANILDRNYRVCFLAKGKYWVNNHAHVLRAMDRNVNGFLCEQLESFDYRKYNSGGAQPKLNQATCRSIVVNVPCLAEQQKIADCLSSLDDVIKKQKATLAAWEELKKGLLQQMFV